MNDQEQTPLSRRQRHSQPEEQAPKEKKQSFKSHGGLVVLLMIASVALLASAPIYGLAKNAPKSEKTASSAASSSKSSTSASSATAESQSDDDDADTSQSSASSQDNAASQSTSNSQSQASADQAASQAASATTAVLGTNQTLYNFAVTHGTTPTQLYALNPGVTSQNYSNFAGQSLRIK